MKEYKVKDEWNGMPVVATVVSGDKIGDPDVAVKVLDDYFSEVAVYAADDPDNDITGYFTEKALDEIAEKILGGNYE